MGIQKIAKINSGSVRKRFGVAVGLNILVLMSSPKSVVGDPGRKSMDSRQQSAGMTKGGSPCPEHSRRVVSLY
jgi:hypothetical protein